MSALDYSSLYRSMHFWCQDTTLKKIFSVEKLNLVGWGWGLTFGVGGVCWGDFSWWEGWVIFGQWGRDFLHPPSKENPVENHGENFKPSICLSPRGRWIFKVPQGLIKVPPPPPPPYLHGGRIPCWGMSFAYMGNSNGPKMSSCGTTCIIFEGSE